MIWIRLKDFHLYLPSNFRYIMPALMSKMAMMFLGIRTALCCFAYGANPVGVSKLSNASAAEEFIHFSAWLKNSFMADQSIYCNARRRSRKNIPTLNKKRLMQLQTIVIQKWNTVTGSICHQFNFNGEM